MSKELYLLVDGTHADPSECDLGADNELRHANGVPVALRADGSPQTVAQDAVDNKNVEAADAGEEAAQEAEQQAQDNGAQAEEKAGDVAVTEINPATGKPSDEDSLLTKDDLQPKPTDGQGSFSDEREPQAEPKPAKAKTKSAKPKNYKNRELRTR